MPLLPVNVDSRRVQDHICMAFGNTSTELYIIGNSRMHTKRFLGMRCLTSPLTQQFLGRLEVCLYLTVFLDICNGVNDEVRVVSQLIH